MRIGNLQIPAGQASFSATPMLARAEEDSETPPADSFVSSNNRRLGISAGVGALAGFGLGAYFGGTGHAVAAGLLGTAVGVLYGYIVMGALNESF